MSAYNDMELAILGLIAEVDPVREVESWAAQEEIKFGWPVFSYLGDDKKCYAYHLDIAVMTFDADLVTSNEVDITVNGSAWDTVTFDTDHDTTMDALVAEAEKQGYDAALTDSSDNRQLTIRKIGTDLTVDSAAVTSGGSQANISNSYSSDQVFIGVAVAVSREVDSTDANYNQYDEVSVLNKGCIWGVLKDETIEANAVAYFEASGSDAGKFSVDGTDINCRFRSGKVTNSDTSDIMAKVEVKGQKKLNSVISW